MNSFFMYFLAPIAALIGIMTLSASQPILSIQHYETNGDYAEALKIARDSYEDSLKRGLFHEAEGFLSAAESLEKKLLSLGNLRLLFDECYQPRIKLLKILELVGMGPVVGHSENALVQINDWAQQNLLRNGERWDEQTNRFKELKPEIKPLLRELGFIDAAAPHFTKYQGALVHGALLSTVQLRLDYLIKQWNEGVRFSHLYFLSGERPLEKQEILQDKESDEFPKNEYEMIRAVWDQASIPDDMRKKVGVHFIKACMKRDLKNGKVLRPTTDDTVEAWLKTKPPAGPYLAVSNAPYINRQDIAVRRIAPSQYSFETIGPAANDQVKTAIFLDELARVIFQIKLLAEIKVSE